MAVSTIYFELHTWREAFGWSVFSFLPVLSIVFVILPSLVVLLRLLSCFLATYLYILDALLQILSGYLLVFLDTC